MNLLKPLGILLVAVGLALPFTFLVAIAGVPVFRWMEQATGIEMIGHSGPADWLLGVIWLVLSAGIAITILPKAKRSKNESSHT